MGRLFEGSVYLKITVLKSLTTIMIIHSGAPPARESKRNSRFYLEGNHMAARTFTKKKVVSFSALFFKCTLTWITEKELERVIEN